jgi:hypothetical protein
MQGQIPFDLEKLNNLKSMNISYNRFSGLVSRKLAKLDVLNMTMVDNHGVATTLDIAIDKNKAFASEE